MASKEIFELEKEHEEEKNNASDQYRQMKRENIINRAVLGALLSEKQYQNIVATGQWESEEVFKLGPAYRKDSSASPFPYDITNGRLEPSVDKKDSKKLVFNSTIKKRP